MSRLKAAFALACSAALFVVIAAATLATLGPGEPSVTSPPWLGEALWMDRTLDLLIQAFILLTGVFAIVLLLREDLGGGRRD